MRRSSNVSPAGQGAIPAGYDELYDDAARGAANIQDKVMGTGGRDQMAQEAGLADMQAQIKEILAYGRQKYGLSTPQKFAGDEAPTEQNFADGGYVEDEDDGNVIYDDETPVIPDDSDNVGDVTGTVNDPRRRNSRPLVGQAYDWLAGRAQKGATQLEGELGQEGSRLTRNADAIESGFDAVEADGRPAIAQSFDQAREQYKGPLAVQGAKRFMAYLTGADAVPGEVLTEAERAVDPEGKMSPSERKLLVIAQAKKNGGVEAGFGFLQAYRDKYNKLKAAASTAADKGDLNETARLATIAYSNLPDGSNMEFSVSNGAIHARAMRDGQVVKQMLFDPEEFGAFLRSPEAQFDAILKGGSENVMGKISKPAPTAAAPAAPKKAPSRMAGVPDELLARANSLYPWVGDEAQRLAYIRSELGQERDNATKIGVEQVKGLARTDSAQTRGTYQVQAEEAKQRGQLLQTLQRVAASTQNAKIKATASMVGSAITGMALNSDIDTALQKLGVTPEELGSILKEAQRLGIDPTAPVQAQGRPRTGKTPQGKNYGYGDPPPALKGKVRTGTKNGERYWEEK